MEVAFASYLEKCKLKKMSIARCLQISGYNGENYSLFRYYWSKWANFSL